MDPAINKALISTPLRLGEHCGREGWEDVSIRGQDEGLARLSTASRRNGTMAMTNTQLPLTAGPKLVISTINAGSKVGKTTKGVLHFLELLATDRILVR